MKRCGDYLVFADTVNTETGEVTRKLRAAEFCRDRLCPMCQWRKSLVTFHQLSEIMDRVAGVVLASRYRHRERSWRTRGLLEGLRAVLRALTGEDARLCLKAKKSPQKRFLGAS